MARIFLSHAGDHQPAVHRIAEALRQAGHEPWMAEERILVGESIPRAIERDLHDADFVVLCLSRGALERGWGELERDATLMRQRREGTYRILPVRLEEVAVPPLLEGLERVDLFPADSWGPGINRLLSSVREHVARSEGRHDGSDAAARRAHTTASEVPAAPLDERPPRDRLLDGIRALRQDWANRIGAFIDAYLGTPERDNVFCGREDDVDALRAWLASEDSAPNLILTSPAGRGKSALLVRFAVELARRDDVGVAFVPLSLRFDTQRPDVFLGSLVARLAWLHGREPPDLRHTNVDILQRMLLDDLARPLDDGRVTVVILDGLDEAVGWKIRPAILPAQHDRAIRIIASARHRPDDPEGDWWARDLGWDRPEDAARQCLPLLEARDMEATLGRLPGSLASLAQRPELVSELTRLCAGEPLTLWLMLDEVMKLGRASLDFDLSNLRERKPGLSAWFDLWWKLQQDQWGEETPLREPAVRAVLNLLSVADGGLTGDDLLELAPAEIPDGLVLEEALRPLSRLIHGDGAASGYVPAHPGLGQHLRERLKRRDRDAWRGRLLAWSRKIVDDLSAGRRSPAEVPRHVVQNRAAYLEEEGAPPDSWMSLATRAWYDAWQAWEPGPSGFLGDVDRAWGAVAASATERFPDELQCALIRGSIGSTLANVQPALLGLLLDDQIWTPEQALAYVREAPIQHGLEGGRVGLVKALVRYMPSALLPQLFEIACDLRTKPSGYGVAMDELLPRMAQVAPAEAIVGLRRIDEPFVRAELLILLAEHLSPQKRASVLAQVQEAVLRLPSAAGRVRLLMNIAKHLDGIERDQALRDAYMATREIQELNQRFYRLADLAGCLPDDLRAAAGAEALAAAAGLDRYERHHALQAVIAKFPDLLGEALPMLTEVLRTKGKHPEAMHEWRNSLHDLPEADQDAFLDAAFEQVAGIADDKERFDAISVLLMDEPGPREARPSRRKIATRALPLAQSIEDPSLRLWLLLSISKILPEEALWPLVEPAWPAVEEVACGDDSISWEHLLPLLLRHAPIDRALDTARKVRYAWMRAGLLSDICWRIPPEVRIQVVEEAIAAAATVEAPRKRVGLLLRILPVAEPAQQEAVVTLLWESIDAVEEAYFRSLKWHELAEMLNEPWRAAALERLRESVRAIDTPDLRFGLLLDLHRIEEDARRDSLLDEAEEAAKLEEHRELRLRELTDLARVGGGARRERLLRTALDSSRELHDEQQRVEVMTGYAAYMPPGEIGAIVECIDGLQKARVKANAYVQLLERCPALREPLFESALAAARSTRIERRGMGETRASALARLSRVAPAGRLRSTLREVLETARGEIDSVSRPSDAAVLEDEYAAYPSSMVDRNIAGALVLVAPHLPAEWLSEAMEIADRIQTIHHRADAVVALAARLEEAEQARLAEQLLGAAVLPGILRHAGDPRPQLAHKVAPLLPEPRRSDLLTAFPVKSSEQPILLASMPERALLDGIDWYLGVDPVRGHGLPLSSLLSGMPVEPRDRVVAHVLGRIPTLDPPLQARLLAQLLPYVPAPWVDRGLEAAKTWGVRDHWGFQKAAGRFDDRQLDLALNLLEADRSSGTPRDPRLEALAVIAAERLRRSNPPRARLRQLIHSTLRERAETRAAVLNVLSMLAPLIVGLYGTPIATDIVRTIRRVGDWWP